MLHGQPVKSGPFTQSRPPSPNSPYPPSSPAPPIGTFSRGLVPQPRKSQGANNIDNAAGRRHSNLVVIAGLFGGLSENQRFDQLIDAFPIKERMRAAWGDFGSRARTALA